MLYWIGQALSYNNHTAFPLEANILATVGIIIVTGIVTFIATSQNRLPFVGEHRLWLTPGEKVTPNISYNGIEKINGDYIIVFSLSNGSEIRVPYVEWKTVRVGEHILKNVVIKENYILEYTR